METDDLYGLPLDQFIEERGKLVKSLRADGRRPQADGVAGLRKPSVAAWAVNQLVRTQRKATKALFSAGDALRKAQEDLLAGKGDARKLRTAGERERAAVDELVNAARGLLSSEGHELSAAVVERVADTLHAAALDEEARAQVQDGRLERELRHAGFGLGDVAAVAATPAPRPKPESRTKARPARRKPSRKTERSSAGDDDARDRAAVRREREAARKAARTAETAARRRVERAQRALAEAQERHDRATESLAKADAALATAQDEAEAALVEHERAQHELKEAGR